MAIINFGGTDEVVITREEFSLSRAQEVLRNETTAVLGYGVQGPGQSLNMRDNGFRVIVGQRKGTSSWDKAVKDGWCREKRFFPWKRRRQGERLFSIFSPMQVKKRSGRS